MSCGIDGFRLRVYPQYAVIYPDIVIVKYTDTCSLSPIQHGIVIYLDMVTDTCSVSPLHLGIVIYLDIVIV